MIVSRTTWLIAAFVCVCVLYLHGLASVGVLGPDEPRYASIGRQMAQSGDWVTPRLWGEPWFEKPVLLYWLVGAAYRLGFGDDWAPRIGVAVISLGFLAFYYMQLRREFGDLAALYASVILATSAGWFAFSQVGVTDLPMAAAFGASVLLALRWVRSGGRRGLLLAGVLLGVAVLAKGLVPIVLASPLIVVGRRRWRDLFVYAGGCLATALPWYWLCYRRNGWPFIQEFFINHHFGRFASDSLQHVQPFWFYVPVLIAGLYPWIPMLAFAYRRSDVHEPRRLLLLCIAAWGLVFFSAATNKLPGYVLPLMPAIVALIGIHAAEARSCAWALGVTMVLLAATSWIASILPGALAEGISRAGPSAPRWFSVVPAAAAAAGSWYLEKIRRRSMAVGVALASTMVAVFALQQAVYPLLDRDVSVRSLWFRARALGPEPCVLGMRRTEVYGLNFYADNTLPTCSEGGAKHGIGPGRAIW